MNHVSDGDGNGRTNQIDLADWSVCVVVVKFWKMSIAVNLLNEIRMPACRQRIDLFGDKISLFQSMHEQLDKRDETTELLFEKQKNCKVEEEEEEEEEA
ncbi:hypothetical protein T12_808 [Trichinella patagoniensis]|uniref:Uncharacterized protein n=1 Tax=Trichinella patagoniensis TaxID=990121 RepID=A0A0V1A729_9BILA|nr:hypothetical protein T12_207 [Trichinella patagoniensis]KRY20233.1 hypothetical protein T12_808 [Trichinella patagoniensis]